MGKRLYWAVVFPVYDWLYREVMHRFRWCSSLCNYCYAEDMDSRTNPAPAQIAAPQGAAVGGVDRYSELAEALGCDAMDSHAGRVERARRGNAALRQPAAPQGAVALSAVAWQVLMALQPNRSPITLNDGTRAFCKEDQDAVEAVLRDFYAPAVREVTDDDVRRAEAAFALHFEQNITLDDNLRSALKAALAAASK